MDNITIGQVIAVMGSITAIIVFIKLIKGMYDSNIATPIKDLRKDVDEIKLTTKRQDNDIQDSKEERLLLMRGVLACLNGLHEQGCNNTVTSTIQEYEKYLQEKAHK